ncbi:hypothetical protein TIFTF001_025956 [Ficus carica]|uniref:C3H1-type domain-containing protein n=1 Tax=Ficus carica TaxID=3494 RepID=A0AA88DGX0_FICCA|nr:hypothetical protein TIFTF001_025956 [Ficus carica]
MINLGGFPHSPSPPNGDPDPATSDLEPSAVDAGGLSYELRRLDLKETEDPLKPDSEDKEEDDDDEEGGEGRDEKDLSGGEIGNWEEGENDWSDNGEKGEESDSKNGNESENDIGVKNGVGEGEKKNDGVGGRKYQYPVRPEAEDCSYYLKTGNCKFGSNCKFNHPVRRKNNQAAKEKAKEREESTERTGQSECKYGTNCRFNHPDPTDSAGETSAKHGNGGPVSFQGTSQSTIPSWSVPRPPLNETAPAPFVPVMIPPNQGVPSQNAEWNGYQAPVYLPDRNLPPPPPYVPATETNIYPHYPPQKQVDGYPERPGQPECSYFLKTGDCKFKSNCKYHHPKKRASVSPPCALSDKGLPLRPDQNPCTYYSRYGICKYGPGCKYDHSVQPNSPASGVENQPPYSSSASMEGTGIARNGSRGETTIQQS